MWELIARFEKQEYAFITTKKNIQSSSRHVHILGFKHLKIIILLTRVFHIVQWRSLSLSEHGQRICHQTEIA